MSLAIDADRITHARRPTPRRSSDKAALAYLAAAGATPISLVEVQGVCTIRAGGDGTRAQWWLDAQHAIAAARMARRFAGATPDLSTCTAALHRSAASVGATLTPGNVAIERAVDAAARLNAYVEAMKRSGALKDFNRAFKRRRMEATLNGRGFMSYKVAEARLRAALIPLLVGGGRPAVGPGMFAQIFGAT